MNMTRAANSFNTAMHWRSDQMDLSFGFDHFFREHGLDIRLHVAGRHLKRRSMANLNRKSQLERVLSRWLMQKQVRPALRRSVAATTSASVATSTELVGSSRISIGASIRMELAYAFRSTLETIPHRIPYLQVSPEALERAKPGCSARGFRIGLAWSSGDWNRERNIRLAQLAAAVQCIETRDVAFYSLQRGDAAREMSDLPELRIIDRERECHSIMDTAATIAHMDLVISVDTMVAHLAAALGVRVWLLLPFRADWRCMIGRDDSPWYPTIRLFRQKSPGAWESVIEEVVGELKLQSRKSENKKDESAQPHDKV